MRLPIILALSLWVSATWAEEPQSYDIVIYGGTSGGIAAAVQAKRMGKSVVVIEPTSRVGGLTTGGLGQTDIGNKSVIGGIAREFYQAVREHYEDPAAWTCQTRQQYRDSGQSRTAEGEDTMWTFEPSVALAIYQNWIDEHQIPVVYGERLDRQSGLALTRSIPWRIVSIRMQSGKTFRGKMFLDASYEGDLLAAAGVAFTVGREANAQYDETLNGVQTQHAVHHQFVRGVDPYVTAGDPSSGLLPFLEPDAALPDGSADHRVQAYCYRMCLTDHDENRIPFHKPQGYDPQWFELLLRNYEAGERGLPWINSSMPNRKTDTNNRLGFSTDFVGQNYDYPTASYERRQEIAREHRLYQQGLMWTLANHPRMPEHVRREVARWGMCKDEFTDGNGWQDQLYVREARRMVSDYVMTQHHCQGRQEAEDAVGMAAYTMDSHHVQRHVDAQGHARNEGDVQVGGFSPYPISYRSIVPAEQQCSNLLVPICLSASHIAFGSIRMEPVFMVLGQSAATAAAQAIDQGVAVQKIDYARLQKRMLDDKQVLQWTGPKRSTPPTGLDPSELPGIVIDDNQATVRGFGSTGTTVGPFVAAGYRHDGDSEKGHHLATFPIRVTDSGIYQVRVSYSAHTNRASNVPVTIGHAAGETTVKVNQRKGASVDGLFEPVGDYRFEAGENYTVEISNAGTDGHVIVDAVQLLPAAQ
jgi:hypothetical protein